MTNAATKAPTQLCHRCARDYLQGSEEAERIRTEGLCWPCQEDKRRKAAAFKDRPRDPASQADEATPDSALGIALAKYGHAGIEDFVAIVNVMANSREGVVEAVEALEDRIADLEAMRMEVTGITSLEPGDIVLVEYEQDLEGVSTGASRALIRDNLTEQFPEQKIVIAPAGAALRFVRTTARGPVCGMCGAPASEASEPGAEPLCPACGLEASQDAPQADDEEWQPGGDTR